MKKTILLLTIIFASLVAVFAQTTPTFPYTAVVRNANNRLVQDSTFLVTVQVFENTVERYSETRLVTTDQNGLVSFNIGSVETGVYPSGSLNDVTDWSKVSFTQTFHLASGDVVVTDSVHPVPYALQVANATGDYVTIGTDQTITGDKTFEGNNDFTGVTDLTEGVTKVASAFESTVYFDTNLVVNVSDLLAVYDTLMSKIADLQRQIDSLKGAGPTPPGPTPTAELTIDPSTSDPKLCGASTQILCTAILTGDEADSYEWSVSGTGATGSSTTNTLTVEVTSVGEVTVTCAALDALSLPLASDTITIVVTAGGSTPATLLFCENWTMGSVTVKESNCSTLQWVNNEDPTIVVSSSGVTGTVFSVSSSAPAGVYTVRGTNTDGCTVSRTATLGKATAHPCTVSSLREGVYNSWTDTWYNHEFGEGTRLDAVSDHEGNVYRVVQIGSQCWLAENMRATTTPNGTNILIYDNDYSLTEPYAYYYDNNPVNANKYGCLYNYPAAMIQGICPKGWHVPNDPEWTTMETEVGVSHDYNVGTGAGKLIGGCDWAPIVFEAPTAPGNYSYSERNSSGFFALPAGSFRGNLFAGIGRETGFWTSTAQTDEYANYRFFLFNSQYIEHANVPYFRGYSVRCVRD